MPYRSIVESEIPVVAGIQARAFRGEAARYVESYGGGGRMDWRELRLFDDDAGRPVAALSLLSRRMSLNGGELDAGLVASVAVPPEHRRRGYGRRMMQGLLEELHGQRTPVSLLFPFSTAWYRGLGYGVANYNWHLDLPIRLMPDFAERLAVRRATAEDGPAIRVCYEAARRIPDNNGWLARGDWEWQKRLREKQDLEWLLFEADGEVEGYLVYTLTWGQSEAFTEVKEWVWTSSRAWQGLAGALGSLGDQARTVVYNTARHDPLLHALSEPYDWNRPPVAFVFFQAAKLVSGFMLRVVHLQEALSKRRYPAHVNADFWLEINDPQLAANCQPVHFAVREGNGNVAPASAIRNSQYAIRTNISTFSELYAGLLSAQQARTMGRLEGDDAACAALSAAFAAAPLHMWPADWF